MHWTPHQRLRSLSATISIGLIGSILLSWKLWLGNRDFPHFPVFESWLVLGRPFDLLLLISTLFLAAIFAVRPQRYAAASLVACILALALQDQMRWQPWFYQYFLMLLPFAFVPIRGSDKNSLSSILAIEQLVIALIYLWGGIHKCHAGFINVFQDSLLSPITERLTNQSLISLLNSSAYIVPIIEVFIGVGLLFCRTRKVAIPLAILTHVVILILIGPVKGNISNSVVWPWNFAMAAMVIILFRKSEPFSFRNLFNVPKLRIPNSVIVFLVAIAPILFYSGNWDRYLSFNLYSGWQKRLYVRVDSKIAESLPLHLQDQFLKTSTSDRHKVISVGGWVTRELNVPLITEWRIIRSFAYEMSQYDSGNNEIVFYIDYRNRSDFPKRYYRCDEIEK